MSGIQIRTVGGASVSAGVGASPSVALDSLDELWFQVGGTVCNLRCKHCFISCAPDNHSFWFMTRDQVRPILEESRALGVKEYYFTGGEPFMNRDMEGILEDTLALGPATVLTNATLIPRRRAGLLADLASESTYSLEIRVSLDGVTDETNDAIRGEGAFARCMGGMESLVAEGFLPIVTAMRSWPDEHTGSCLREFRDLLAEIGYDRARLKILPPLLIGEEVKRTRGYDDTERVTHEMLHGYDSSQLLCTHARLVTATGVHACPILLDFPTARLGATLGEAVEQPVVLGESACFTCYLSGTICSNVPPTEGGDRVMSEISFKPGSAHTPQPESTGDKEPWLPGRWGEEEEPGFRRVAVFGGVYSNHIALRRALEDAQERKADAVLCLGDLGAFGPHPNRTAELLREANVPVVCGNYDDSIARGLEDCQCGYTDPRDNHYARLSYDYTLSRISEDHRRWMARFPYSLRFRVGEARVFAFHGSPRRMNEFLWETTTPTHFLDGMARDRDAAVLLGTHTGIHWSRRLGYDRSYINVGALGRPANNGRNNVWYVMLEAGSTGLEHEFIPLTYDYNALAREMEQESLPTEFIETIRTGWWTTCLEVLPGKERAQGRW